MVIAVLLVVVGPTMTNSTAITMLQQPEAATAVVELLMMGLRTRETC